MSEQPSTHEYYSEDSNAELRLTLEQDLATAEELLDDIENARRLWAGDREAQEHVEQVLLGDLVERVGIGTIGGDVNELLDMLRQTTHEEIARLESQLG